MVESPLGFGAVCHAKPLAAGRVSDQFVQRDRQRIIIARDDQWRILRRDHIAHIADISRDNRETGRHRLNDRERHLFGVGGQGEDVEAGVK